MEYRLAEKQDLGQIMELIRSAKQHLKSLGIDQWQTEYPDQARIECDIKSGTGYLLTLDGHAAGYVCIDFAGEPRYLELKGQWKSVQPYAAVHRLAIAESCRGKGLAHEVFRMTEELCRRRDVHSIKVDTDEDNLAMKHLLASHGFEYCGVVQYDDCGKIAYEKVI